MSDLTADDLIDRMDKQMASGLDRWEASKVVAREALEEVDGVERPA